MPKSFVHISGRWQTEGREHDDPYFGWLSSALDHDPTTVNLATNLHSRPVGVRPFIELEPTNHPPRRRRRGTQRHHPRPDPRDRRTRVASRQLRPGRWFGGAGSLGVGLWAGH
ncbi:DUF2199 domain-containing protein [Kribbella sp. VKM Ac-2568]|uniref:DUF2199 domain-containing protein n=1 Tax=Kribbella sp. VKM Ac-2568 TaxID=2512219 RepID=UPI0018EE5F6F